MEVLMTDEYLVTALRTFLQMLGAVLSTYGVVHESNWPLISGLVMSGGSLGWMLYVRWGTIKVPADSIVIQRDKSIGGKFESPWVVGVVAIGLAFMLAGCNQAQLDDARDKARATLEATCAVYPTADAAFQTIVAAMEPGKIPRRVIEAEAGAVAALAVICASPPTDLTSAIRSASTAYAAVMKAVADARAISAGR